jgi:hypothetical protein
MNIIIDRTHCAIGLKIEVVNEGTVRIDCSNVSENYNPTVVSIRREEALEEMAKRVDAWRAAKAKPDL